MQESRAETRSTVVGREFLDWWRWDSIGAACEPMCGGCRCGNCQPGGKDMTLSEERELEMIRQGLSYVKSDAHSQEPHWDTKYPWIEDPSSLHNNRNAVEATFLRTEKQLKKEPEWCAAYTSQVHEMVERGAAKKLSKETIADWKGPVWYVSHLVAPNPHSVTTPVRLVWNSSQKFRGISMNDLLLKGPDVLNPIRAVLLRFRRGVHAALGDIRKMYNSVWLEDLEMHLHRFLWRNNEDGEIEEYAITRVNIGDRPAGCIAQLAMRETAKLPIFSHLEEERRVLEEDSYVDDILTSHNDLEKLDKTTKKVEEILKAGGFFLKPWVQSGQSGRQTSTSEHPALLNQKSTSVEDWRWIPGEQNIADLTTRGATPEDLKENSVWQNGPEFLKRPVEEWPTKVSQRCRCRCQRRYKQAPKEMFYSSTDPSTGEKKHNMLHLPVKWQCLQPLTKTRTCKAALA